MPIETGRGRFEVLDLGAKAAGPALVLLHAFPFSAEFWRADAEALAPRMRVIAPSMRGFGASTAADLSALSIDMMADDVAAILDALAVTEPVVLGGLSMGGYVTLAFARRHAGRLRGLVLADTRAEPDSDEGRANRDKAIVRIENGDLAGFVDGLLETALAPVSRDEHPELVATIRAMALRASASSVTAALRALRDRPDARPGLSAVAVPTLVVVGEQDVMTPPSAARSIAEAVPRELATLCVIPQAGHFSNLEEPRTFREALARFHAQV